MDDNEKQRRLREYLKKIFPAQPMVERADMREFVSSFEIAQDRGLAGDALENLETGRAWTPSQMDVLEAIILPRERPVIDIVQDDFDLPEYPFGHFLSDENLHGNIVKAIPNVGCIELPGMPHVPYGGTGFIVGPELLMTNRHVAELFCQGLGRKSLAFRANQTANVNFKREIKPGKARWFSICKILMIHPYWDMALFQTDGLAGITGLTLSTKPAAELGDADVAVIGYPAFDERSDVALQNKIFRGIFRVKRLQPGKLNGIRSTESYGKMVDALAHDASTLGGNSGSVVLDVKSGYAVGLHFGGEYLKSNYAVPSLALAQDSRVVDAGVTFESAVAGAPVAWDSYWLRSEESVALAAGAGRPLIVPPGVAVSASPPLPAPPGAGPGEVRLSVPLEITVNLGTPSLLTLVPSLPAGSTPVAAAALPGPSLLDTRAVEAAAGEVPDDLIDADCLHRAGLDLDIAVLLAQASEAAYGNVGQVSDWAAPRGFTGCQLFDRNNIQGFWCRAGDIALLCFRGTSNPGQWLRDARFIPGPHPWGWVHIGFRDGIASVEPDLQQFDDIAKEAKRLWIIGHSLGGALALVAAARYKMKGIPSSLYTYGQPRVGLFDFARRFDNELPGGLYRFVNQSDIVTRVPPGFLYQHSGIVKRIVRPGVLEAFAEAPDQTAFVDHDNPPMTEDEFARLQAELQAASAAPAMESMAIQEGLFSMFSDHYLTNYITLLSQIRTAAQAPAADA